MLMKNLLNEDICKDSVQMIELRKIFHGQISCITVNNLFNVINIALQIIHPNHVCFLNCNSFYYLHGQGVFHRTFRCIKASLAWSLFRQRC